MITRLLETGDTRPCLRWFEYWTEFGAESSGIVDVFTHHRIDDHWVNRLPSRSVEWFADFFVLRCVELNEDYGLGENWTTHADCLSPAQQYFVRGRVIGTPGIRFNPTVAGSYFLTVEDVCHALNEFPSTADKLTQSYVDLLERCGATSMGVYNRIGFSPYEEAT